MNIDTISVEEVLDFLSKAFEFTLFKINQTPITVSSIFMFVVVLAAFYLASKVLKRLVLDTVLSRMAIDSGLRFTFTRTTHYIVMIVGSIVAFQFVGIDLSGLAVIFGLLSVGIGFGLQNVTSNFIAGLILLFERPIKLGDRVTVGDTEGDVQSINIRSTMIRSLNNISIIVPNSEFVSSRVINWSHGDPRIRIDIAVGVSYGSDLDTVLKALHEVADEHPQVLPKPRADVLLKSFGDSSWNMVLRCWIDKPHNHHFIRSEINQKIVRKFRELGVEIPFPQRDLHLRSATPLPVRKGEEDKES